jgi:hypothetical protein
VQQAESCVAWDQEILVLGSVERVMRLPNPRFSAAGVAWKKDIPVYHATTGLRAVLESGLKSRARILAETGVFVEAAGGQHTESISFTTDPRVAESIVVTLWNMSRIARGEISMVEFRDRLYREYPNIYRKVVESTWVGVDGVFENAHLIDQGWFRSWDRVAVPTAWKWVPPVGEYKPQFIRPHIALEAYKESARIGHREADWPMIYAKDEFLRQLRAEDLGVFVSTLDLDWLIVNAPGARATRTIIPGTMSPGVIQDWNRSTSEYIWDRAKNVHWWHTTPHHPWSSGRYRPPEYIEVVEDVVPTLLNTGEYAEGEAEIRVFDSAAVKNLRLYETISDILLKLVWRGDKPPLFYPYLGRQDLRHPDLGDQ